MVEVGLSPRLLDFKTAEDLITEPLQGAPLPKVGCPGALFLLGPPSVQLTGDTSLTSRPI